MTGGMHVPGCRAALRGLVVALLSAAMLAGAGGAVAAGDDEATGQDVTGVVLVNDRLAPAGTEIDLVTDDDPADACGSAVTDADGGFELRLAEGCDTGEVVGLLRGAPDRRSEPFEAHTEGQLLVRVAGLSDAELEAVGIGAPAPQTPEEQAAQPLIENRELMGLLVLVVVISGTLLGVIVFRGGGRDLTTQTQAIVYIGVIIAVTILGVTGKVGSDGLIAVLAAIVGWEAAKTAAGRPPRRDKETGTHPDDGDGDGAVEADGDAEEAAEAADEPAR